MNYKKGFTIVELIIVIAVAAVASIFFFIQKSDIESAARDTQRKTAINAIYYSLEEVYFKENGSYPRTLEPETLPSVDEVLFKDPSGVMIGESDSDYRYEPTSCDDDKCEKYTLRTTLESEDDFIRKNRD